jgi:hypothetical protein
MEYPIGRPYAELGKTMNDTLSNGRQNLRHRDTCLALLPKLRQKQLEALFDLSSPDIIQSGFRSNSRAVKFDVPVAVRQCLLDVWME